MIRQDFFSEDLPPKSFMMQIADSLTKTYCFLWEKKNKDNVVELSWQDLSKFYNKNNFRTNLRKLNCEGLLSYSESDESVFIELVSWQEVENAIIS